MNPTPTWITFPAHAMPDTDWSDHRQAHRAVMRLFTPNLPGADRARRAAAGILYRLDTQPDGTPLILVQSQHPAELLPPTARAMTLPANLWLIPAGTPVRFRVAVNPVTRRTVKHDNGTTSEAVGTVPADEIPAWLADKIGTGVRIDQIINHIRSATTTRHTERFAAPPRLAVDTVDAIGTVTDTAEFARIRTVGVGRAKAYGCGLLTAVRAR